MLRQIISIDEEKCNGCGLCVPDCPEGALAIIDGKARLVGEIFCDGLGACIGRCPQGAITIEERDAEPYDERVVMSRIEPKGKATIIAHLQHLKSHGEFQLLKQALSYCKERGIEDYGFEEFSANRTQSHHEHEGHSCPGSRAMTLERKSSTGSESSFEKHQSRLRHWPVQISLLPVEAPFFQNADLLLAADCVPFAYADFHEDLLRGKVCLVGCPKLDDAEKYLKKLSDIFRRNSIRSVTVAHMEVPCCSGMDLLAREAAVRAGKDIPIETRVVSIGGELLS